MPVDAVGSKQKAENAWVAQTAVLAVCGSSSLAFAPCSATVQDDFVKSKESLVDLT